MVNITDRTVIRLRLVLGCLMMAFCGLQAATQAKSITTPADDYQIIEMKTDTLPSLNIARTGHVTLCLDGELTVFGGHADGFLPSATAEYFRDGAWHTVPLAYPHDHGVALELRSGKVFLAGGHKEPLGMGQLFSVEFYDPATHTSKGFGSMQQKRAFANAIEMSDGQVVISGNWYAEDGIEMFSDIYNPLKHNAEGVKATSIARANPYMLRISDDDAIIFGAFGNTADTVDCSVVDRLKGSSYREPFLDTWHPLFTINAILPNNHFIGDEAEGRYQWLLPVENDKGHVAIARINGPDTVGGNAKFSLLPTGQALPDTINGKPVCYSSLVCDRERQIAYLIGDNDEARIFVVAIPYGGTDASPLTIFMTEPQPNIAKWITPVRTPEGDLVFAGGHLINNFTPSNTVTRLPLGETLGYADISATEAANSTLWIWIVVACLIVCLISAILIAKIKKKKTATAIIPVPAEAIGDLIQDDGAETMGDVVDKTLPKDETLADLFRNIERLMQDEKLYLNANLKASDVAALVCSNTAYVSAAVNSQRGCSFSQYLTAYRIAYAQTLMREYPERKLSMISAQSGFTTDSTFFRAFRAVTGMSPKEWQSVMHNDQSQ